MTFPTRIATAAILAAYWNLGYITPLTACLFLPAIVIPVLLPREDY